MAGIAKKISHRSAKQARKRKEQDLNMVVAAAHGLVTEDPGSESPNKVKEVAAKLYGRGFTRAAIARALVDYLTYNSVARNDEQRLSNARSKLKRWEQQDDFRNLVYKYAVVELDMDSPGILKAVAHSAKKGRVDAAKLALEITGRHSKEDTPPTQVTIQIANLPRPE
jgi:hypothetical protein